MTDLEHVLVMKSKLVTVIYFQANLLLELHYRSPLEGNEDSEEEFEDDDDEEFIPNVGLVSHKKRKAVLAASEVTGSSTNALMNLEQNIAKLEQSILANNQCNNGSNSFGPQHHVTFAGSSSRNGSNMRRSSSLQSGNEDNFQQKKKKPFNFPNVKKRYVRRKLLL